MSRGEGGESSQRSARGAGAQLATVAGSSRGRTGLLTNALSSIGNLGLTLTIAHLAGLTTLGQFALAFSIYVLVTSLAQSGLAESALGAENALQRRVDAGHEVSLIGLVGGTVLVGAGLLFHAPFILVMGACLHGMLVYDFIKTMNIALLDPRLALRQEASWTLLTFVGVGLGLARVISPEMVFAVWAVSGAAVGYVNAVILRLALRPRWPSNRADTRISALFAVDQLLGPGTVFLSTYLLAGSAGLAAVGAIRAGATFFGPFSLVSSTTRSIAIPFLARSRPLGARVELDRAIKYAALPAAVIAPAALAIAFLPAPVYEVILGGNTPAVTPLLLPLALDCVMGYVGTMPFSGLRAHQAALYSVVIYAMASPLRLALILTGGVVAGALGAAWGMLATTTLTTIMLWSSFWFVLFRKGGVGR